MIDRMHVVSRYVALSTSPIGLIPGWSIFQVVPMHVRLLGVSRSESKCVWLSLSMYQPFGQ